jgi:hypothetical protein
LPKQGKFDEWRQKLEDALPRREGVTAPELLLALRASPLAPLME